MTITISLGWRKQPALKNQKKRIEKLSGNITLIQSRWQMESERKVQKKSNEANEVLSISEKPVQSMINMVSDWTQHGEELMSASKAKEWSTQSQGWVDRRILSSRFSLTVTSSRILRNQCRRGDQVSSRRQERKYKRPRSQCGIGSKTWRRCLLKTFPQSMMSEAIKSEFTIAAGNKRIGQYNQDLRKGSPGANGGPNGDLTINPNWRTNRFFNIEWWNKPT